MNKKWMAALITITVMFAALFIIHTLSDSYKLEPLVENGVIDLREWDFKEQGLLPLNGAWELYRGQLLGGDGARLSAEALLENELVKVPDEWPAVGGNVRGEATYRLRLITDEENQVFGVKTSTIRVSNRLIVNGQVVAGSGVPGPASSYEPKVEPYAAYFTLAPGYNELLIQVANKDYPAGGGIVNTIYMGHSADIAKLNARVNAHDWIMLSSFLLIGLFFSIHFMQRLQDRAMLSLGMVWVWLAVYSSLTGERLIFTLYPDMPFWLYIRLQFGSALAVGISLSYFVLQTLQTYVSKRIIYTLVALQTMLIMLTFTGDLWEYRFLLSVYFVVLASSLLYMTYMFLYAAMRRVEGSIYLAITGIIAIIYGIIQGYANYFGFPYYQLPPFVPFLVLFMLSLLMSHRTVNSYRQIEALSVQLLQADKLKDDFITRTSHEFKTPLHGIQSIASSLIEDSEHVLAPSQREKLALMMSTTRRLSQLVYDILDMSKLKQGELTIAPVSIDVRSTVDVLLHMFEYMRRDRDIVFINHVPEQMSYVYVDENRFRQIMSNLLDNALKFTDQGSIEVYAREVGQMIEIAVKDTGCGISELDQSRIFDPMISRDAEHGEGFGLGLAIVRQLVDLHHGSVTVVSKLGEGATFLVQLPSARGRDESATQSPTEEQVVTEREYKLNTPYYSEQPGKYTILIADDHDFNLKILIDALESMNCTVIAVKNGSEAVARIRSNVKIDIAILDLMMPELSGIEVCRIIRKSYTPLELPVVMVTAAFEAKDKLAAFDAGANDYLPKPFEQSELKARILGLLAMKESLGKAVYMEMAFLQSQIKPHFLFNVLHSIIALSYKDIEKSRMLTNRLADYLRGSFQFNNTQRQVPFETELNLIQAYLDIEQVRFMNKLQVDFEIDEEIRELSIPPLLLQPLVENAIRHGVGARIEGGRVHMTARAERDCYRFTIEDDGVGIPPHKLEHILDSELNGTSGVGLQNINRRLKFEYGVQLRISSVVDHGTKVMIEIPRSA